MPTRAASHELEDESRLAFQSALPRKWVYRELSRDYGIDAEVEIFDEVGDPAGAIFKVQLKATRQRRLDSPPVIDLPIATCAYYRSLRSPVLLVAFVAAEQTLYAKWFHQIELLPSRPNQRTIRCRLSTSDEWTNSTPNSIYQELAPFRPEIGTPGSVSLLRFPDNRQRPPHPTTSMGTSTRASVPFDEIPVVRFLHGAGTLMRESDGKRMTIWSCLRDMSDAEYPVKVGPFAFTKRQLLRWAHQSLSNNPAQIDAIGPADLEHLKRESLLLGDDPDAKWLARTGKLEQALPRFEALLQDVRGRGDDEAVVGVLNELGLVYRRLGHLQEAERVYRKASGVCRRTQQSEPLMDSLFGLAMTYEQRSDYVNAGKMYTLLRTQISLSHQVSRVSASAKLAHCVGRVTEQPDEARSLYDLALQTYRESGDLVCATGPVLMDLARALIQLERFGDAFDALDEATAVFERVGDVPGLAGLAINVSLLRLLTGARISAARCFRQAEDLYARAWCVPVQDTTPRIAVEKTVIASFADVSVSWVNWLAMYTRRYQEKALGHLGAIVVGDLDG